MEYRQIGNTELRVSEIGFGCGGNAGLMVRGSPAEQRRWSMPNAVSVLIASVLCPGYIQTPMTAAATQDPARRALIIASEPVGRMGHPEEVAETVVWLCSNAASFVIGHALTVDGGYMAQ